MVTSASTTVTVNLIDAITMTAGHIVAMTTGIEIKFCPRQAIKSQILGDFVSE
jgi:hypothetical protein